MDQNVLDEEMSFAAYKLDRAQEALSDQIALIYRLKMLGLGADFAGRDLDRISIEYRRWQEYRTLLLIRRGMAREAFETARSPRAIPKLFASIDYRGAREIG